MFSPQGAALISLLGLALSACATVPGPEPCSAAWFSAETRQAFAPIRRDARRSLERLRSTQAMLQNGGQPGLGAALSLTFAMESGLRVVEAAQQDALPRLQAAAGRCDDPAFVRRAVFDFLEQEGVADAFQSSGALAGLEPILESMLDAAMTGELTTTAPVR